MSPNRALIALFELSRLLLLSFVLLGHPPLWGQANICIAALMTVSDFGGRARGQPRPLLAPSSEPRPSLLEPAKRDVSSLLLELTTSGKMRTLFFLFLLFVPFVSSTVIDYNTDGLNEELEDCITRAAENLNEETCLFFRRSTSSSEIKANFIESTHCAWQKDNKTVHLNMNCATDEVCYELLGRIMDVQQPKDHISRHLNLQHNCTDKCTLECLNGGKIEETLCHCQCGYGFNGERCENLSKKEIFTDNTCGVIDAEDRGHIALSSYPSERRKDTFCQWLIRSDDPWTVIDAEIEELGLDNEDLGPHVRCNDQLYVYGAQGISTQIPCDKASPNVTKLHSTHNWLLIELKTNPYSTSFFKGPSIRYSTRKVQPGVRIYSEGMSAAGAVTVLSSFILVLFI